MHEERMYSSSALQPAATPRMSVRHTTVGATAARRSTFTTGPPNTRSVRSHDGARSPTAHRGRGTDPWRLVRRAPRGGARPGPGPGWGDRGAGRRAGRRTAAVHGPHPVGVGDRLQDLGAVQGGDGCGVVPAGAAA